MEKTARRNDGEAKREEERERERERRRERGIVQVHEGCFSGRRRR